ncbi:MAG: Xaa-Pro peptidase family protein, partial [Actinomycetota bacterium]|nr:Xaa-Pro peptidase family protein [Actinomycetota bacterium]
MIVRAAISSQRIARAREAMAVAGIDAMVLSVGTDLPYLIGYEAMPSERLTMAVFPATGTPRLLVPELEAPRVAIDPEVCQVQSWGEQERPVDLIAAMLAGTSTVALGDHTWARFLLALQDRAPLLRFVPASTITAPLRLLKDDGEIALLAAAGTAADRVAIRLAAARFSGRTERNLGRFVADALVEESHDTAAFTIVASGPNGASPHHEPTDRVIERGDTVVVDFGGRIGGYCSDTTRTFSVGEPAGEVAAAYEVLQRAQQTGVEAVRPGVTAESIDAATRRVLDDAGYGRWFI